MRDLRIPMLLSLVLALASQAAAVTLSGSVVDEATRKALPGAHLALAGLGISTTTASDGSWSFERQTSSSLSAHDRAISSTSHLVVQSGRIVLRYRGRDVLGHGQRASPMSSLPVAAVRANAVLDVVDTLVVSWNGVIRGRLPISDYSRKGIAIALDTSKGDLGTIVPWNGLISYDTLIDNRDGQVYWTVKIGTLSWMAENLNFKPAGADSGWCYLDSPDSCSKYGRLYTWRSAMDSASVGDSNRSATKGICPIGWHVPSDSEWQSMEIAIGMSPSATAREGWRGETEGNKLKSVWGWQIPSGGTDLRGLRFLPGGSRGKSGNFSSVGEFGDWWSSTEVNPLNAWMRFLSCGSDDVYRTEYSLKTNLNSLRCVQEVH